MRYYDPISGELVIKRRYKWAWMGFAAGVAVGVLISVIF